MGYREWLPADDERRRRRNERRARVRRAAVRVLTRMTATAPTRPLGELGMRLVFDRMAGDWDQIRADPVYRDAFVAAVRELPGHFPVLRRPPARVLDVACGTGLATTALVELFPRARVTGIDIAAEMVARAQRAVPAATFVAGSALQLPFDEASFDLVVSLDGVYDAHELARVTAPEGAVVLVYSRGGDCPVARPVEPLAAELAQAGLRTVADDTRSWWAVWAFRPLPPVT